MSGRVTVVGSANVDFVMRLPSLPRKGETVAGGTFSTAFGGKGSNQAVAARRAGAEVAAVFSLGGDNYANTLMDIYRKEGMDVSRIVLAPDASCGSAVILVDSAGDNAIAVSAGANALMTAGLIEAAEPVIAASDIIMLQMEIPDDAIRKAIEAAARSGVDVMLNYAPARPSELRLDPAVTILVVNETEAGTLSGLPAESPDDARKAAEKLAENGHRLVIITLGANGCVVHENGRASHHPAFQVDAVDATAAGDTFCGALAAALAEKRPLAEAVRFASAAGALSAATMGAMPSIPSREEIEYFSDNGNFHITR